MAEGLLSLAVAEPSDVVAANFERVGDGETVVDWHQTELIVAEFLDEDIFSVPVEVKNAHIEHSDLVNFVSAEEI